MNHIFKGLAVSAFALAMTAAFTTSPAMAQVASQQVDSQQAGAYQIVKATDTRVWRLNVHTGEVSVCTLGGENLICTTSSNAMTPPTQSYEQYEADRARTESEQRKKDMAFFERLVSAARMLFAVSQDSASTSE